MLPPFRFAMERKLSYFQCAFAVVATVDYYYYWICDLSRENVYGILISKCEQIISAMERQNKTFFEIVETEISNSANETSWLETAFFSARINFATNFSIIRQF